MDARAESLNKEYQIKTRDMLMNEVLDRTAITSETLTKEQFESPLATEYLCNICYQVVDPAFFDCSNCDKLFCTGCVQKDMAIRNK